jgi:2-oxo-3-hexenedioate decarboxylase/2-keto-4-pentenoate hydratase
MEGIEEAEAEAAEAIVKSRTGAGVLGELPPAMRPFDEAGAYRVQRQAHVLLESAGFGPRAGWKIGCTTRTMQEYLGVPNPCAGGMFSAHIWRGHHRYRLKPLRRLGVECELAVRLGHDLGTGRGWWSEIGVASAVAACMAAIEVVEDRYEDYSALGCETLIADDFFHHSCVLGPEHEGFDPTALRNTMATMWVNGREVGRGRGADVMGEPLAALGWLANSCADRGFPLKAGELVLLGSVVQTQWVGPGDQVQVENDRLGQVGATFEAGTATSEGGR